MAGVCAFAYPNMIVEHYTAERGLPNNIVNCTLKGTDGFVWFGTWYGLCSFDGAKFRSYDNRDGFYSADIPPRKIQRIVEDKNGFLWLKTIDRKLYLFDKKHETFHAVYDDVKEYSENIQIIKIQTTEDGDVLLLTKDKSLLRAHTDKTGKITMKQLHDSRPNVNVYDMRLKHNVFCETAEFINWIGMDYQILSLRKGSALKDKPSDFIQKKVSADPKLFTCASYNSKFLWLGDQNGHIYSIDPQNGVVNRYEIPEIKQAISRLLVTESGLMYITTNDGAYEYNIGYKQLIKLPFAIPQEDSGIIFYDKYDKIWFQEGNHALIYYDPLNKSSHRFTFPNQNTIGNFEMQDAGEQGMFFLTPGGEILLFDRDKLEMTRINQMKPFSEDLPNQLFFHLLLDKDGILWLASTGSGVYRVNFPKKQFQLLTDISPVPVSTEKQTSWNQGIRALYQAQNGDIWVGTRWQALYRLDRNGQVKQIFSDHNYLLGAVYHIMEDKDGNLWFSTKGNGLVKAEPDMNSPHGLRFTRYKNDPKDSNSISNNDVYFTYQDSQERIWVGLLGGGLNLIAEENGEVVFKHKYNGLKQYPPYGLYMEVRTMTEDEDGRIWVGTMDGLMSFDGHFATPEQIQFETYRQVSERSNVADNDIYVLYKDTDSQIWVSVFGGGLNKLIRYDKEKHEPIFKSHGIREGMNNDVVKSIVEDKNGNLWFTTEIGLSCFNKATEQFRNYDKYDGFLNVELEEGSTLRTLNGDLWLGTRQGILAFSPDKLETQHMDYDTRIVDFKVSNRDLRSFQDCPILKESIIYTDAIQLKYNQSMFTIEFAALNFYNQNRVSYRYILEGYEKEWHYNGKNRIASYTNVPPGDYHFMVKTRIKNQEWSDEVTTLDIHIVPPLWLTWWAKCSYVLLSGAILFFILYAYKKKLDMEVLYDLERKNHVQEQELNQERLRFYTNITHELRTPLTLILGPLEDMQKSNSLSNKDAQKISVIHQSAIRLLNLINQILEFRKTETQNKKLCVAHDNIANLVYEIGLKYKELNRKPDIEFRIELEKEDMPLYFDKEIVTIILDNLISNAIKYTEKGSITLGLHNVVRNNISYTEIKVSDTGFGITPEALPHIFNRYYQEGGDHQASGTGIGLALVKNLVTLHEGEIKVESTLGTGSTFYFSLLTDNTYPHVLHADSPERTVDEKEEKEEIPESASGGKRIMLIVEDNQDICNYIAESFSDDFEVKTAANGEQGMEQALNSIPDIIVSDIMMPVMNGIMMCKILKEDVRTSHIPIILLTAKDSLQDKEEGYQVGADSYLTKPFSATLLHSRINNLLESRKRLTERFNTSTPHHNMDEKRALLAESLNKLDNEFIEKINQLIEARLSSEKIDIGYLADNMCMSKSTLYRKMKALTGLSTNEYVRKIKMQHAERLLLEGRYNISEVAFRVGINSVVYFRQCFKEEFGVLPSEYLKQ